MSAVQILSEAALGPGRAGVLGEATAVLASPTLPITTLVLPAPPSVNALFKNIRGVGRVRTSLYDRWADEAGWRLKAQRPVPVLGPVMVVLGVERTSLSADIDNRIKALFDLLVAHRVIEDDSKVVGFAAAWSPARDGLVRLAIRPAADATVQFQLASDGRTGGWFLAPDPEEGAA